MVCYALLCVFSRFALILMLASAMSMWERRLDLYMLKMEFAATEEKTLNMKI